MFGGYSSGVDCPVSQFYEALANYYPDAKIILTVSDDMYLLTAADRVV